MFKFENEALNEAASKSFALSEDFEVIPDGTVAIALIESAEVVCASMYNPEDTVKITWRIQGGEYANRVVFQKIKFMEQDATKRLRQQRILLAIDANARGQIRADGGVNPQNVTSLQFAVMQIHIKVWEMDGKKGNWISAVSEKGGASQQAKPRAQAQVQTQAQHEPQVAQADDVIPF